MQQEGGKTGRRASRLGVTAALTAVTMWSCGAYDAAPPGQSSGGTSGHVAAELPDGQAGDGGIGGSLALDGSWTPPVECPWPVALDASSDAGPACNAGETCDGLCSAPDGGVVTDLTAPCGQEQVSCGQSFAPLEDALAQLALCCQSGSEFFLDISFAHGCATRVALLPPYNEWTLAASECIAKSLAGKSIACAPALGCAHITFTTLK